MRDELALFSGNANRPLAQEMADYLGLRLGDANVGRFKDGEIRVSIHDNVRGVDAFVVQPTEPPADNLLELLIMIDAIRRASARRITAVIPYFGYARQDRKDRPRVAITAKLVANLLAVAGADRVLTMDLHAPQIQGFFDIPLDHIYAAPVFLQYFDRLGGKDLVVMAPDIGSIKMARAFAKRLGAGLGFVDKRRPKPDAAEVMNVVGEVEGRHVIMVDDIVSTGTSLIEAANAMKKLGASKVTAGATHAVFAGDAVENLQSSLIEEIVITNTLPRNESLPSKIRVLSVAELLGEAIDRIHGEKSVSSLFV
ncbi:MAG: ribose-phosphate diphosphokinase [Candidatus Eisenbacteria bacterium]|nr:ribose-phosphate diphosphokinase [Candidatus Eisenbacteria bacterium]